MGKGSHRRPQLVSDAEFGARWEAVFGGRVVESGCDLDWDTEYEFNVGWHLGRNACGEIDASSKECF